MMLKIGITQRVESVPGYHEIRDCLDQQWSILLQELDILLIPIPNQLSNPELFFEAIGMNGFILSGGNDIASAPGATNFSLARDLTERKILDYAFEKKLPLFGVCRGIQMMNVYLGGTLTRVENHVATRHQVTILNNGFFNGNTVEKIEVNSYHHMGFGENELGENLQKMAWADDDTIEAVYHKTLPWMGIMWHPEREKKINPADLLLIQHIFGLKK